MHPLFWNQMKPWTLNFEKLQNLKIHKCKKEYSPEKLGDAHSKAITLVYSNYKEYTYKAKLHTFDPKPTPIKHTLGANVYEQQVNALK